MIILEGADALGKTTAAKKLCSLIAAKRMLDAESLYRHMTKPPDDFDHLSEYLKMIRFGVQDRFHLGSVVYGAMLGRGSYISAPRMELVQRHLAWQGCLTVIMTASREWLREQLRKSSKVEMYSVEDILRANECYRAIASARNRGMPYCDLEWKVDVSGWPEDRTLAEWIDRWLGRWGT